MIVAPLRITEADLRCLIMQELRRPFPSDALPINEELSTPLFGGHARSVTEDDFDFLQKRLGPLHAKLRLGIEADHEAQVFGQGINYFHIENLRSSHFVIRTCLQLTGLYWRGRRNAAKIAVRHNHVTSSQIPKEFDGFTILQLSDLHVDMSQDAMDCLTAILKEITYDLCVLTGDYRGQTFGPYEATLAGMSEICAQLKKPAYGVLGNHDTVRMVPGLEEIGIRMLLNEYEAIKNNHQCISLLVSMMRIFIVQIILRRLFVEYRVMSFRFYSHTRQKSIDRRPLPTLISY